MTDDDLTPEQDEVRRLLAASRHVDPAPEAVVARLERVLADLADEPVRAAPVAQLSTRRRRASSLLLAAAAVVAIGVGVGQVVDTGTDSESDLATADRQDETSLAESQADGSGDAEATRPGAPADRDSTAAAAEPQADTGRGAQFLTELERRSYVADVDALRARTGGVALSGSDAFDDASSAAGATCLAEAWGEGRFVPVRYDGVPAVLVLRRATGDTQVADLYLCGETTPRRSVTLPVP